MLDTVSLIVCSKSRRITRSCTWPWWQLARRRNTFFVAARRRIPPVASPPRLTCRFAIAAATVTTARHG